MNPFVKQNKWGPMTKWNWPVWTKNQTRSCFIQTWRNYIRDSFNQQCGHFTSLTLQPLCVAGFGQRFCKIIFPVLIIISAYIFSIIAVSNYLGQFFLWEYHGSVVNSPLKMWFSDIRHLRKSRMILKIFKTTHILQLRLRSNRDRINRFVQPWL